MALDEDRLEDWVELFDEECDYRVVTRENVEQGLPNVLMWCDNKNMLRDRVESYREVNEYNLHYDRHVIGPLRMLGEIALRGELQPLPDRSRGQLAPLQRRPLSRRGGAGKGRHREIKTMLVVADTGTIPSLLATPI